jgi:hypothetical protein
MKALLVVGLGCLALTSTASAGDTRCYEMRTYYAAPGKLEALHARFRDHTCKLFEKHGMVNVGYWVPVDNADNKLIYILAYPSREAREASWKAFIADPAWREPFKASEANGKLVERSESVFLTATDYSPAIAPKIDEPRVFELRTYTAAPGKLANLNARFRDHTVALFEKHGIRNVAYWTPATGQSGADNTLIYIVAHKSQEAAKESFGKFGQDPDWKKARAESEERAGGSLTVQGGVKSMFMKATDYSPTK